MECPVCGTPNGVAAKFCSECGTRLVQAARPVEVRKTVTVVFCDLTGSTALGERHDPEALRAVMTRYFTAMREVLEAHGGSVEKFIGDAVMAVFGVPVVHEDDALRAVRAAWQMQSVLAELSAELTDRYGVAVAARIGVNTGEVVVGDGVRGTFATGDPVNVAARLEQAAAPGEVLVGEATWRLIRGLAPVEPVAPLALKGKADGVAAWRLTGRPADIAGISRPSAGLTAALVGRDRELRLLSQALDRTTADRTCQLFTVLGSAGIGKTRLIEEFRSGLPAEVAVLAGRCLSYGEGTVFFPLLEILRDAAGLAGGENVEDGRARLAELLGDAPEATRVVERLAPLAGLGGTAATAEDTHWAVRTMVESIARRQPLVLVIEDVHWAEPAFLAVLEHLTDWARDAPVLLIVTARPEFLEAHPSWGGGKLNATTALLEPLDAERTSELVCRLVGEAELPPSALERITAASDGMPLFVEQLLGMLIDEGRLSRAGDRWDLVGDLSDLAVPPTISALLAARLDRLTSGERTVFEAASVVGGVFYAGAVAELVAVLAPDEVRRHLLSLVRKELARPTASDIAGEDAIRFRHILLREAAYAGLSKARRAELHERLARWLDKRAEAISGDADQFVGHHLEQAVRLRRDVGPADPAATDLAQEAADRLAAAARRIEVADPATATTLVRRAADLVGAAAPSWPLLQLRLAMLLGWGFHYEQAADTAYRLATVMERRGDERWTTIARALLLTYRAELGQPVVAEALAFVDAALERFVAADDDQAVLAVAGAKNLLLHMTARSGPRLETIELLTRAAAALGDDSAAAYADIGALTVALHGPLPVVDDLRRVDQIRDRVAESGSLMLSALIFGTRATLLAYEERLAESLEDAEACLHAAQELTGTARAMLVAIAAEPVAVVGDPSRAEALLRDSVEEFLAVGERGYLASVAPRLGDLCLRRGDHAEAARWAQLTQDITPADDNDAQARWRALAAKLAARAGRLDEAVRLADQAVEYESVSDDLVTHAERFADRAEVMRAAGRLEDEAADLRRALDCYRQKGHRPGLRWIGGRLSPAIPAPGTGS